MNNTPIYVTLKENNVLALAKEGDKLLTLKETNDGTQDYFIEDATPEDTEVAAIFGGQLGMIKREDGIYWDGTPIVKEESDVAGE